MLSQMRFALLVFALGALVLAGCGSDDEGNGEAAPSAGGEPIEIVETDFALDPATVTLDEPGTYTFRAVNEGGVDHALEIEGHGIEEETEILGPGESGELTVEITEPGEYELYCPVGDHKDRGMEGSVTVGGAGGATTDGTTTGETTTEDSSDDDVGY
jgi:plastocyanin